MSAPCSDRTDLEVSLVQPSAQPAAVNGHEGDLVHGYPGWSLRDLVDQLEDRVRAEVMSRKQRY